MGRYSDSEEDKKKRKKKKKKRSRSRSSSSIESRQSSKHKKSKKSKHKRRSRSKSRSPERSRRRSRSYDRYRSRSRSYGRRSRSRSRDRYSKRSRSRSRDRYSRSRSRSRSRERRRKRSRDRGSRRSRSRSRDRRDSKREIKEERDDPCAGIPGFSDMTPAEQARIRMNMALRAAAAADEKLKESGELHKSSSTTSFDDQLKFSQAIQDIESTGFAASAFKSSRGDKKEEKPFNPSEFTFGTAGELRLDMGQRKPVIIDVENDELAHPNFHVDTEVKMERWIQKLNGMRKRKLEGEVIT